MSNVIKNYRAKLDNHFKSHKKQRVVFEYVVSLLAVSFSALVVAFAFKAFLSPSNSDILPLISGGTGGIARIAATIGQMINNNLDSGTVYVVYSVIYAFLNIPILYIAFRYIGFRFALFTAVNVILTSILTSVVNLEFINQLADRVACLIYYGKEGLEAKLIAPFQGGILSRTVLAGLLNGFAAAITFSVNASDGGVDTLGYFFSLRKSISIGKYSLIINSIIYVVFAILNLFYQGQLNGGITPQLVANALLVLFFACVYSLVASMVIDFTSRHNKKEQIQIITSEENLSKLLLSNIPHGATIVRSKGAFTGEDHIIIYIVVSIYETQNVVSLVRKADPHSFVYVTSVKQLYGRFFTRKIK